MFFVTYKLELHWFTDRNGVCFGNCGTCNRMVRALRLSKVLRSISGKVNFVFVLVDCLKNEYHHGWRVNMQWASIPCDISPTRLNFTVTGDNDKTRNSSLLKKNIFLLWKIPQEVQLLLVQNETNDFNPYYVVVVVVSLSHQSPSWGVSRFGWRSS